MAKYRKKPVVIEAVQFVEENLGILCEFCPTAQVSLSHTTGIGCGKEITLVIPTLEGDHIASLGDWIIRGVNGEFYPCKPDIFEKTYEKAE